MHYMTYTFIYKITQAKTAYNQHSPFVNHASMLTH